MKKLKMMRAASVALVLLPVATWAQPADPRASASRNDHAASAGLTLQEFVARYERNLMAADTDGDGKISMAEFRAAATAGKGDPEKRFTMIDRNRDGLLDQAEIEAMLTRRFKHRDTNGDGVLSAEERAAAHAGNGRRTEEGPAR